MQVLALRLHFQQVLWLLSSTTGPCQQCVESNLQSWQQSGLSGVSHGTPLTSHTIQCKSILVLEASFDYKKCSVGRCLLYDLAISFSVPSYMSIFLEDFTTLGFHSISQMAINFSCLSRYSLSQPPFPSPPLLIFPFQYVSSTYNCLFYSPFLEEPFAPLPQSLTL